MDDEENQFRRETPPTSDDTVGPAPIGITSHIGNRRPHTRFRFVPTKSCAILALAMLVIAFVVVLAAMLIVLDIGDTVWSYGVIMTVLGVALVKFKDEKLPSP